MAKENLAEMPENYDMMDEVKASAVMNETEEQKIVASNVNDNQEGENPPSPKGGAATKAVEENTVNENARDISQPLTVEDIVKSKQLSPEMLAEIINAAKNDNLFPVDNLDGKELTDKINELHEWVNAEESRLKSIPFSIELYNQKKAVLQARAAYVLILECLIGEKLREIPRQNGTNENSESRASGETRTKSQIIKEEYGLSPRLARDFQHLTWDGVKAAIGLAFKQKDNHINNYELDELPIPLFSSKLQEISNNVQEYLLCRDSELLLNIDSLVNEAYGITNKDTKNTKIINKLDNDLSYIIPSIQNNTNIRNIDDLYYP